MSSTRRALLASLLIALTVAAGQALAGVPNVELITFLVFVSGFLLGPRLGAVVGGVAMGAHSMFNVMGAAAPPILVAQIVSYVIVGFAGGTVGRRIAALSAPFVSAILFGATGAALSLIFQVIVGVAGYVTFGTDVSMWVYIWGGIAFTAIQIAWNAGLFFVAARPTCAVLARFREDLEGTS